MITEEIIAKNKERFLALTQSIERDGVDMDRLIRQLTESDFFDAPASTIYHCSYKGGLCEHSLHVYDTLRKMCHAMYTTVDENGEESVPNCPYSDDTIKIVALFHDFDKMNKYEQTIRNQKVYSEVGTKSDGLGKFDWVSVPSYKKKDAEKLFTIGTHGENSVYMTETFIPLTVEEHCAILNHHNVYDNPNLDSATIYSKYPLACLLHLADMASTYVVESHE